jgi:hypothetical protein
LAAGLLVVWLAPGASGCVSKSKAKAQAQEAFIAGQQQAMTRLQGQSQTPQVAFVGPVKNRSVPWSADLTVAKAIVAAGYFGAADPRSIVVLRNGQAVTIDPQQLLNGEDMLLLPGDLVQISE